MTMLQTSMLLEFTQQHRLLHQPRSHNNAAIPPIPGRFCCKVSRRELAIFTNSSLLLASSHTLLPTISTAQQEGEQEGEREGEGEREQAQEQKQEQAQAQEQEPEPEEEEEEESVVGECMGKSSKEKRAILEVSIDGEAAGRITLGVYEDIGGSRFLNLVSGRAGISYRRKEFVKIMPGYVQHAGVRSYGVDAELAKTKGANLSNDALKQEWERRRSECRGTTHVEGSLGIVVRDPFKPPPKPKLVARGGKLVMDEEEIGLEPNGTEFVICTKDCPELDDSSLVIGRVVQGMDVVRRIAGVKTVQDNTTSPYFRVAKLIGDKRAVVAEKGFNRPYSKVLVTNCALLE